MTAKEWRDKNPNLNGNIRDYATMNELICLANLENLNSVFINEGLKQSERLEKLNKIAISQMQILNDTDISGIDTTRTYSSTLGDKILMLAIVIPPWAVALSKVDFSYMMKRRPD